MEEYNQDEAERRTEEAIDKMARALILIAKDFRAEGTCVDDLKCYDENITTQEAPECSHEA